MGRRLELFVLSFEGRIDIASGRTRIESQSYGFSTDNKQISLDLSLFKNLREAPAPRRRLHHRHAQHFGKVQSLVPGCLPDLLAAAEPVRDHQGVAG